MDVTFHENTPFFQKKTFVQGKKNNNEDQFLNVLPADNQSSSPIGQTSHGPFPFHHIFPEI